MLDQLERAALQQGCNAIWGYVWGYDEKTSRNMYPKTKLCTANVSASGVMKSGLVANFACMV